MSDAAQCMAETFSEWVDRALAPGHPAKVVAFSFNLYEHVNSYAIELIGCSRYDPNNPDWAQEEIFSFREEPFELPHATVGSTWREGLGVAITLVKDFINQADGNHPLRRARAVTVGFVDGDLICVWPRAR